jgi:hypothetical protein
MTAFDLCRQHPELELAPILRIVKYLGLDSTKLSDADVARIVRMHPHFLEDPELIVGVEAISHRAGLPAQTVADLLVERRSDVPYVGSPRRPMMPTVGIEMLRELVAPAPVTAENPAADTAAIRDLEAEIEAALDQVRSLSRTLSKLSRQVRRSRSLDVDPPNARRQRHRRSGGGRPDTIVEACRKVLEQADGPMKVADITAEVVSKGVDIKAKNPNVTVSSILSSYEVFERVRRGYYTLAANPSAL